MDTVRGCAATLGGTAVVRLGSWAWALAATSVPAVRAAEARALGDGHIAEVPGLDELALGPAAQRWGARRGRAGAGVGLLAVGGGVLSLVVTGPPGPASTTTGCRSSAGACWSEPWCSVCTWLCDRS
ncbi:hypothetical protein FHN55_14920 [Streptomyces sp. NP160]|uniref:hypothetical protein n=1 Tax=Streptomyces sp. NP160 TaxID=2586637 RepID=UPI00111B8E08|nr:hypothetical protein [Streptomyces sp. NP160]TNM64118.1 hypothetical protein FHN55_14920 [Streptomyces sp. NP160]